MMVRRTTSASAFIMVFSSRQSLDLSKSILLCVRRRFCINLCLYTNACRQGCQDGNWDSRAAGALLERSLAVEIDQLCCKHKHTVSGGGQTLWKERPWESLQRRGGRSTDPG